MLSQTTQAEAILGYQLREKIGAGGYGEVWSAEAPGGLQKAVKLIFGFHDENRAQRELKSLNRIKEVRHPFLLSLERIDVVDGRLVVVTELAERSLKDLFVDSIRADKGGIPRDELLGYLSDAAEALDYLSESHGLQHLDIKPENLLLVGGHVKVADFGLVKDIHDGTQSMMSGLTPTYAPPELFDGRPNRNSDQYSLAIVFQEMLTGTRPFDGRTAAQLASQHLTQTPDLRPMPQADHNALKRALTKNPDLRYPCCREFVEELRRVKRTRVTRSVTPKRSENSQPGTMAVESSELAHLATKLGEEKRLPIEMPDKFGRMVPTYFIGIGETATSIVGGLKRRIRDRVGAANVTSAFQFLCVDTDTRSLDAAARPQDPDSLDYDEILPTPLRASAEYRDRKDLNLSWLSRRWIYNIPRNQQTQCLRPLGRLAFVDHHAEIFDRIQKQVSQMVQEDAIQATAASVRMPAKPHAARVFVVASISGGVGSGMVNDMAYAARTILAEQGVEDAEVNGLLLYSTGRASSRRDVTTANAYACLSEMHHYTVGELGYPGDEACDLPAFVDEPTFDNTYLIDLGQEPLPDEYVAMADELAEYLYLNSATACGEYFDACREADRKDSGKLEVRSLGVCRSGGANGDAISLGAGVLAYELLTRWASPQAEDQPFDPRRIVANAFERLELSADTLAGRCRQEIEHRAKRDLNQDASEACVEIRPRIMKLLDQGPEALRDLVEERFAKMLGGNGTVTDRFNCKLVDSMDSLAKELIEVFTSDLKTLVLGCLDEVGGRISQAHEAHRIVSERLQRMKSQIAERQKSSKLRLDDAIATVCAPAVANDARDGAPDPIESRWQSLQNYAMLRIESWQGDFAARLVSHILREFEQFGHSLRDLAQGIEKVANDFEAYLDGQSMAMRGLRKADMLPQLIANCVSLEKEPLLADLDLRLQDSFFNPNGGFQSVNKHRLEDWLIALKNAVEFASRRVTSDFLLKADFQQDVLAKVEDDALDAWVTESSALAVPYLLASCGGGSRLTIALPQGTSDPGLIQRVERLWDQTPQVIQATHGDIVFCCELGGVALTQVAAMMLHGCPEAGELIDRIHVRTDVAWQPIIRFER